MGDLALVGEGGLCALASFDGIGGGGGGAADLRRKKENVRFLFSSFCCAITVSNVLGSICELADEGGVVEGLESLDEEDSNGDILCGGSVVGIEFEGSVVLNGKVTFGSRS